MSFKYLFNNNFTDNRLLQKMPNYEAEAQMFQEQQELERQKQQQQIQQQIDQISQQGMAARGLSPETIGVSPAPQKSTKPNVDWNDPVAVNKLYHGDYSVVQGNNGSPAVTPVTTPKFDPNAGKQDAYNQQLNAYLKEYFSERGWSERKERKAIEYFNRMFNWDWNANVGKRKSEFETQQLALQRQQEEQQERQRQLDRQIEEQDARTRKLEEQGRRFNGTDWELDPEKVKFSGFDGNMETWGNKLKTVFDANKDNKIWAEIAGDDAVITQDELKAWQQKKGLQVDGKLGFNTLQAMGLGDQKSNYSWMHRVIKQKFGDEVGDLYIDPITGYPVSRIPYNPTSAQTSSNQGTTTQTSATSTQTSSAPQQGYGFDAQRNNLTEDEREKIWAENNPMPQNTASPEYQKWLIEYRYAKSKNFLKTGGTINKYKQGNKMNNEQELQKAFMAYLIEDAAAQGVQIQSEQDLQAYAQQLGEEGLKAKYQEFMQKMQGQGIKAALGTKLNYIRKIKGMCPDGQETYFFKEGGSIKSGCKPCMAKAQKGQELKKKGNAIDQFKNRPGKKKAKEPDQLPPVKKEACGGKAKKKK